MCVYVHVCKHFFFCFLGWDKTVSTWYVGHYLACCTSPGWWWWVWGSRWNENWEGKSKYSMKACSTATSSATNPTWPYLASNPNSHSGMPATNLLSYDTAFYVYMYVYVTTYFVTIDGLCINNCAYWTLTQVVQISITHVTLLSYPLVQRTLLSAVFTNRCYNGFYSVGQSVGRSVKLLTSFTSTINPDSSLL
jgi:hypothetical protein